MQNLLSGLNVRGRDVRTGVRWRWRPATYRQLELIHDGSDIAKLIVNKIPELATKKWLTHVVPNDSEMVKKLVEEDDRLKARDRFRKAMAWSRLYGGAAILFVVDDNKDLDEPLDMNSIGELKNLIVLHRWELNRIETNESVNDFNFGMPTTYSISGRSTEYIPRIHHSRLVRFEGSPLSEQSFRDNDYWDDSYLNVLSDIIRDYESAYSGVFRALQDFDIEIFKIKDLANLVSSKQRDILESRIQLMNLSKSIMSTVLIDANNESFERLQRNFTNIGAVLDKVDKRLQMAVGLPHTILFGEGSTGTLGAGGESEQQTLNDLVAGVQRNNLYNQFMKYAHIVQSQKTGPTNGKILPKWSFDFNPLNEPTEQQQATVRDVVATTDNKYFQMGVLTADEIAQSRFGGDGYSTETQIDKEARAKQKELDDKKFQDKMESDPNNPNPPQEEPKEGPPGGPNDKKKGEKDGAKDKMTIKGIRP